MFSLIKKWQKSKLFWFVLIYLASLAIYGLIEILLHLASFALSHI